MMITITAPTRIDLAGGTLDIRPLSALFAPAVCINLAINLSATVTAVKTVNANGVLINAAHLGRKIRYGKSTPERYKTLFHRALDVFPVEGWEFSVKSLAPAGSGLGGSSAVLIAFLRALFRIRGENPNRNSILEFAKNIEAQHIGIPTGTQDYIAALYGGINILRMKPHTAVHEKLKIDRREPEQRIVLAYSGSSRLSAQANWFMFKKAIEKKTEKIFRGIADNSLEVERALTAGDFSGIGPLLDRENRLRERLGPAVIPAGLKRTFSAVRKQGGFPKICGAGGGGCFIVWCEPAQKPAIEELLENRGARLLPFRLASPSIKITGGKP